MFTHRVLPLPPQLYVAAEPIPQSGSRDNLQNGNMSRHDFRGSTETMTNARKASLRSSSPSRNHFSTAPERNSLPDHQDSALVLRSSSSSRRKRTSSQDSVEEIQRSDRVIPSISPTSTLTELEAPPSQVCLCQPDPKVPRPRNAFILYRQHHQAGVVSRNPGLANPEISKIIGDYWRSSSQEIKDHWKLLAEEEKLRHQRQYPDYRYQPRRNGRNSITSTSSSSGNLTPRCAKCGGRSMISPPAMSTPSTPMNGYSSNTSNPNTSSSVASTSRFMRNAGGLPSPQTAEFRSRHMTTHGNPNGNMLQLAAMRNPHAANTETIMTPDSKRRRFANGTHVLGRTENSPLTPFPFSRRRESLPRPDFMPKNHFSMAPPPRPSHNASVSHDGSLTLPPLKTANVSEASTQAKSVEAMVMSISAINKIKVLAKICPPLPPPGPTSPPQSVRGVVVAVDGTDRDAVTAMVAHLKNLFDKDQNYKVREWDGPTLDTGPNGEASFADYLRLISSWHSISVEVTKFITTAPFAPSPPSPASPGPISPKTIHPPRATERIIDPSEPTSSAAPTSASEPPSSQHDPSPAAVPIAIIPYYQLTLTDAAASTIPIADAYAPVDHWQWMACLWRGIVGPDVTIAVRSANYESNSAGEIASPRDESTRHGATGVDVRLGDARAIVLKCDGGSGVNEAALRRMGFEVGEWVRGMGSGQR